MVLAGEEGGGDGDDERCAGGAGLLRPLQFGDRGLEGRTVGCVKRSPGRGPRGRGEEYEGGQQGFRGGGRSHSNLYYFISNLLSISLSLFLSPVNCHRWMMQLSLKHAGVILAGGW